MEASEEEDFYWLPRTSIDYNLLPQRSGCVSKLPPLPWKLPLLPLLPSKVPWKRPLLPLLLWKVPWKPFPRK